MATPASTQQSYTAGTCRLDVTSQLSALSEWSARPMVSSLTFQLWLEQAGQSALVAQGDRTDLQTLSTYIQNKTRSLLAVAALNSEPRSSEPDIQPPLSLQRSQPLSYLQLCDLNTVLTQYEQSARALPFSLAATTATSDSADNVVAFSAARTRTSAAVRAPRPRQNRMVWASSAAAALFAIGLTSTLWSRDPALQQSAIESATPESVASGADADEFSIDESEPGQLEPTSEPPTEVPQSASSDDEAGDTTERPIGDLDQQTAAAGPQSSRPQLSRPQPSRSQPSQTISPPVRPSQSGSSNQSPVVSVPVSPTPAPARSPSIAPPTASEPQAPTTDNSPAETAPDRLERNAQREDESFAAPVEPAADAAAADETPEIAITSESVLEQASLEPESLDLESLRSPASISRRASQELSGTADVPAEAIAGTINQVQTYFQSRWEPSEDNPLSYELQLSAEGEVESFVGLDDVSQEKRDQILPVNAPPVFPRPTTAEADISDPLTLRVLLQRDGVVQVLAM